MKRTKLLLLIIAFVVFVAGSAFADMSYTVTVDTTSLYNTDGYLYFQYNPFDSTVASTATVNAFTTNGTIGAQGPAVNGSAVSGTLPGTVTFANTNLPNDYNHAIHFGNTLSFNLALANTTNSSSIGTNTFSLGFFADDSGLSPLITTDGTLFTIDLNDTGATSKNIIAQQASVNATPIPAAVWLFGSGLTGLVGIRKRMQK